MSIKLGLSAKLFWKSGGVAAVGSYAELSSARDITLALSKTEVDVTTRASGGWSAFKGALKNCSVDFEVVYDLADAGVEALRDSFFSGAPVGMKVLDGGTDTSGKGVVADFEVMKFDLARPLDGMQFVSVTIKPTYSSTAPSWQAGT